MPGQESIVGAIGPMAVTARDCELFIKTVLDAKPWETDPSQVRMPWRPEEVRFVGGEKPRIGVMWHDGVCAPQPPMARALRQAVDKLKAAGFEVVDYEPYQTAEGWSLLKKLYFTDGGERIKRETSRTGEPILPLTKWIMDGAQDMKAIDVAALVRQREAYRYAYAQYWNKQNIDVMLCPPYPGPAPQLGTSKYWAYTAIFNLTDYPGAVLPTPWSVESSDVPQKREMLSADDELINSFCKSRVSSLLTLDSPEKFVNAPLALQLIAGRWEDEKLMEAFKVISKVVNA